MAYCWGGAALGHVVPEPQAGHAHLADDRSPKKGDTSWIARAPRKRSRRTPLGSTAEQCRPAKLPKHVESANSCLTQKMSETTEPHKKGCNKGSESSIGVRPAIQIKAKSARSRVGVRSALTPHQLRIFTLSAWGLQTPRKKGGSKNYPRGVPGTHRHNYRDSSP